MSTKFMKSAAVLGTATLASLLLVACLLYTSCCDLVGQDFWQFNYMRHFSAPFSTIFIYFSENKLVLLYHISLVSKKVRVATFFPILLGYLPSL